MLPCRLSVVLPTHNRAEDLPRAARSVLSQSLRELELLIVDDGSTDGTHKVIEQIAARDDRVRPLRNEHPLGPGGARNRALDAARGELVAFCDDDDAWLPGAAQILVDFLSDHPDVVAVSSWHQVMHLPSMRSVIYRGPTCIDERRLLWHYFVPVPFGVIRRASFDDAPRFDPQLRTTEDWDLWLRCAQQGTLAVLPQVLYLYRQHRGSRVTRGDTTSIRGRQSFLDKHAAEMTHACRLYHEVVIEGIDKGRQGIMRQLWAGAEQSARDAAGVTVVLSASLAALHVGRARRDPGLQARVLASLIARQP